MLLFAFSFANSAQAEALGVGVEYGTGGTLGTGTSLSYRPNSRFSFRITDYAYQESTNKELIIAESILRYKEAIHAKSKGAIANFHPFKGKFYVAGGLYQSDILLAIDGVGAKTETFIFDYTSRANVGLRVSYDSQNPYIGVGWQRKYSEKEEGFGIRAELGVFEVEKPEVSYYLTDLEISYAGLPYTDAFNRNEEQELRDEIENNQIPDVQRMAEELKQYVVLEFTITYHF